MSWTELLEFKWTCSWKVDLISVNHACLSRVVSFLVTSALAYLGAFSSLSLRSPLARHHLPMLDRPCARFSNRLPDQVRSRRDRRRSRVA